MVAVGCALIPTPVRAQESVADTLAAQVGKIFQERRGAVVKVRARDGFGIRSGSGFFADPSGTIYTHAGIVLRANEVTVVYDGKEVPAKVLTADERSGIAILKIDSTTPFIPTGDSRQVRMATPIVAIGYPEELEAGPSFGIISGFDRQHLGQFFSTTHFRANLPAQRGQGGAPALNLNGEAIGILVGRIDNGTACYILPMRAAEKVRTDLIRFGETRPGWVGVQVEDSTPVAGEASCTIVGALDPETPAAKSGLQPGDRLVSVGGTTISTSEDVVDASYFLTAGDPAEIVVRRGNETLSVTVKPTLHPLAPGKGVQSAELGFSSPANGQ